MYESHTEAAHPNSACGHFRKTDEHEQTPNPPPPPPPQKKKKKRKKKPTTTQQLNKAKQNKANKETVIPTKGGSPIINFAGTIWAHDIYYLICLTRFNVIFFKALK